MYSALALTLEIDDMALAASDLAGQINVSLPRVKNRCGILFGDPGYEWDELLPLLEEGLDMPVTGASASAMLSSHGYHGMAATLLVMGGNDCVFGTAVSLPLDGPSGEERLRAAFEEAKAQLGGAEPEVIFTFSALNQNFIEDARLALLREMGGNKPVFGGVASDYFEFSRAKVFGNGKAWDSSVSLLLAGGNIRPEFIVRNVPLKQFSKSTITSSSGSIVHTIDNISAYDYMLKHGADISNAMALHFCPLCLQPEGEETIDGQLLCRPLIGLDKETGDGTALCEVPMGSAVTVQTVQSSDIADTTRDAMETLLMRLKEKEDGTYQYSTILGISCSGRHMVLALDKYREGELAMELFPKELNFAGFYSFGEFCPVTMKTGDIRNRLHNMSLSLCAF